MDMIIQQNEHINKSLTLASTTFFGNNIWFGKQHKDAV